MATHGHNTRAGQSPTYKAWHAMKQRCLNPNKNVFHRYGGRGITVCERWLSFENFLADMGVRPDGLTLDRIDPDGNYDPENCRWATQKQQCNNWRRREQFIVRYRGEEYTLQELADKFGLDRYTLRRRITTSRWPEEMWHLPPDRHLRPSAKVTDEERDEKVLPRGTV